MVLTLLWILIVRLFAYLFEYWERHISCVDNLVISYREPLCLWYYLLLSPFSILPVPLSQDFVLSAHKVCLCITCAFVTWPASSPCTAGLHPDRGVRSAVHDVGRLWCQRMLCLWEPAHWQKEAVWHELPAVGSGWWRYAMTLETSWCLKIKPRQVCLLSCPETMSCLFSICRQLTKHNRISKTEISWCLFARFYLYISKIIVRLWCWSPFD